ncbi:hypothetical protein [Thorsellia anophelis]|uniref:Phage minor structural protein GP20 n=1 Tax=Thorsellia anophelis DSM 18579 TaxID=1123402 RepID=A0A1I0D8U4_9GAMM|nr:hypothetical protein [Thorsellia anophelis]SET28362.1 hypothetical protein SAMN02583745_01890 [Thorsellia anophelis DSM 18579]
MNKFLRMLIEAQSAGRLYRDAANGDGDGGGSGDGGNNPPKAPEITPEVQAIIDKKINEVTTGLKNKNSELHGKLKEQAEQLKNFEGFDPVALKALMKRVETDEEAKLIAEGNFDEVINRRTERFRSDTEKQLQAKDAELQAAREFANKFKGRMLGDLVRGIASKAGALSGADEDLLLRAQSVFKISDDGEAVALDKDGSVIYGKDGRTPLTVQEWIESTKETAPHLWPQAQGTGAGGTGKPNGNLPATLAECKTDEQRVAWLNANSK